MRRALVLLWLLGVLAGAGACTAVVSGTPSRTGVPADAVDCARPSTPAVVSCLAASLSRFWTAQLHRPIRLHAVVDPAAHQVPRDCRPALRLHTAFSCPTDHVVYLTAPFVRRIRATGPSAFAWLRIATTLAHEMGHIVQFAVHTPLLGHKHPSDADSRRIEQQADCLAGVWSASAGIAAHAFAAADAIVLGLVDSGWERRTHGTAAVRLAAVRRGQHGRTAAACGLARGR